MRTKTPPTLTRSQAVSGDNNDVVKQAKREDPTPDKDKESVKEEEEGDEDSSETSEEIPPVSKPVPVEKKREARKPDDPPKQVIPVKVVVGQEISESETEDNDDNTYDVEDGQNEHDGKTSSEEEEEEDYDDDHDDSSINMEKEVDNGKSLNMEKEAKKVVQPPKRIIKSRPSKEDVSVKEKSFEKHEDKKSVKKEKGAEKLPPVPASRKSRKDATNVKKEEEKENEQEKEKEDKEEEKAEETKKKPEKRSFFRSRSKSKEEKKDVKKEEKDQEEKPKKRGLLQRLGSRFGKGKKEEEEEGEDKTKDGEKKKEAEEEAEEGSPSQSQSESDQEESESNDDDESDVGDSDGRDAVAVPPPPPPVKPQRKRGAAAAAAMGESGAGTGTESTLSGDSEGLVVRKTSGGDARGKGGAKSEDPSSAAIAATVAVTSPSEVVTVSITDFKASAKGAAMFKSHPRKLFVAFDFPKLSPGESETPFGLLAPTAPGGKIVFNFRKVIPIDRQENNSR